MKKSMLTLLFFILSCLHVLADENATLLPKGDLNPFPNAPITKLRDAGRAQEFPNIEILNQAWSFYRQVQGTWIPNTPKPDKAELERFKEFAKKIKTIPLPTWVNQKSTEPAPLVFDIENSAFKAYIQTPDTQLVKTLCLVYMTEHELNSKGALLKAADLLYRLLNQTPFDPEVRFLYAKTGLDVDDKLFAFYNARIGLLLVASPSEKDLEFVCHIGLFSAKDRWADIQTFIRFLAIDPNMADSVLAKYDVFYTTNGKLKFDPSKVYPITLFPKL